MFILKLHFCFLRMNIDVNLTRIQLQIQEKCGNISGKQQAFTGFLKRFIQIRASEKPSIHKKKLFTTHFFGTVRFCYVTVQFYPTQIFVKRNETCSQFPAENL